MLLNTDIRLAPHTQTVERCSLDEMIAARDPDVWPWVKRYRYVTVGEVLADYDDSTTSLEIKNCASTEYLREHVGDNLLDVNEYIYSHEEWGPMVCTWTMYLTFAHNNSRVPEDGSGPLMAQWIQHYMALALVRFHPWARARGMVEQLLAHQNMKFVSREAAQIVLDYVVQGHPNPGRFLALPEVAPKFALLMPLEQLATFPAPDFPPSYDRKPDKSPDPPAEGTPVHELPSFPVPSHSSSAKST
jgi:hypothetical protein